MKIRIVNALTWLAAVVVALILIGVFMGGRMTHIAIEYNSLPLMRTILVFGVSPESSDPDLKITPLMKAAIDNKIEFVELLIDNGADINARDQIDSDPLIYAVRGEHTEIARLFLERGSSPTRRNASGESAFSIAKQDKDAAMLSLLGKYADSNTLPF